jgi:integrase
MLLPMRYRTKDVMSGGTATGARATNGKAHEVGLSDFAVDILAGRLPDRKSVDGFIFPSVRPNKVNAGGKTAISGFSRAKEKLDAAMGLEEPFILHDLRRTATTHIAEIGVPPHVVDKLLNHRSGTIKGVTAVYNRHEYKKEQREALQRWSDRLREIVAD